MTKKVLMLPTPHQAQADTTNSIHQIVLKLAQHLPEFGYEVTENRQEADLIAGHAGQTYSDVPCDIAHCHGLYPTAYPQLIEPWHVAANQSVVNNLMKSRAVTVPSQWVADILRRDLHLDPVVVPWAIDFHEWNPGQNKNYVLWNKTRVDGICDPSPAVELAKRVSSLQFVSTFASQPPPNMRVTERLPYVQMKTVISEAGVYLATTKETFGIGILEAMACGVPILGYKHGNVSNIVQHGVTGYLVDPGDLDGLQVGLEYCIKYRETLGQNARKVAQVYSWSNVSRVIAQVYDRFLEDKASKDLKPKVSVVIPVHNYARYVKQAAESVLTQKTTFKTELIIVDDGSEDNSAAVAQEAIETSNTNGMHCEVIRQNNMGVAATRNNGIAHAQGEYILCLDADDMLGHEDMLQKLAEALDHDRGLGIVFTGLRMMAEDGTLGNNSNWPNGFDFEAQIMGRNQVPTCCMFRREAWRRAGGYKALYTPAEDAELWTRIAALGYRVSHAIPGNWFHYRLHAGSLSSTVREGRKVEPDWLHDKPWVNDRQFPLAANGIARPVRNYDRPKVTIIIPVADYHVMNLPVALDSVEQQTERSWQCIVVNDTGSELPVMVPFPWAKVIDTGGHKGAGVARNLGVKAATSNLVTFLDADDILMPTYLEKVLKAYQRTGRYVYTDWFSFNKQGVLEPHETPDFLEGDVFKQPIRHSINVLLRKKWVEDVGWFDETMRSWEDVDFFMRLAKGEICGVRVPEPLLIYKYTTGRLREFGETIKPHLIGLLNERYEEYIKGSKMCGCSGTPGPGKQTAVGGGQAQGVLATQQQLVRIQYTGPAGSHDVLGSVTRKSYGRRQGGDVFLVFAKDQAANPTLFVPIAEVTEEKPVTQVPAAPSVI